MGCAASSAPRAPPAGSGTVARPVGATTITVPPSSSAQDLLRKQASSDGTSRTKAHHHRERVVYAKGFSQTLVFEKIPKTPAQVASILRIMDQCYLFSNLSNEQREDLSSYMRPLRLSKGDQIEDYQSRFFGIETGEFAFIAANCSPSRSQRENKSGESKEPFFGEMSLMFDSSAASEHSKVAVCCSQNEAMLWTIDRDTFRQVIASSNEHQREEKRAAVTSIKLLKDALKDEELNLLIEAVHLLRFPRGHEIVRKGDPGEVCYFIKQGKVLCSKIGENELGQVELDQGSYFGERALLTDEPRAADVHALTDVVAMCIARKDFDELLGPLRSAMDLSMKERVVESLPILKELNPRLRQEVVADFELEYFTQGDIIVKQGDSNVDKFYVVRAGVVKVLDNGEEIATLGEGSWFGEMALLAHAPRVATCVAHSPKLECFVLRRATFQQLVQESKILNATHEQRKSINLKRRSGGGEAMNSTTNTTRKIMSLSDLQRHHILGKGTFGTVFLVSGSAGSTEFYALKCMNKQNLVRCEQRTNVMNEKQILGELYQHPFVLDLYQTFQDRDTLYMLLEFVQGGELFSIMQERFRFPLYPAVFYSACIIDVFQHVHSLGVVYRDLKPENVLIDRFGYVKLADFGFAKRVTDKTYTLCGTPEYLAPEVVLGSGHDKAVDFWGVGILIYEMLVGMSPFADEYDEDQHVVCNNILRGKVSFDKLHAAIEETEQAQRVAMRRGDSFWQLPPNPLFAPQQQKSPNKRGGGLVFAEVEDLVKRLLTKSPVQRFGNAKDGAREVKRHLFFASCLGANAGTEASDLLLRARRVLAPYVPTVSSADDSSRFDKFEPDTAWPAYTGSQDWCKGF